MTTQQELPAPPPEAVLIAERRKSRVPRLSMRQAAIAAGISPTSWAEIELARKKPAPGIEIYRAGTPEMIAPMARVLRITPDELRACGRADAAEYLELIVKAQDAQDLAPRQADALSRRVLRALDDGGKSDY